jgi:hypothetical protein
MIDIVIVKEAHDAAGSYFCSSMKTTVEIYVESVNVLGKNSRKNSLYACGDYLATTHRYSLVRIVLCRKKIVTRIEQGVRWNHCSFV